MSDYNDADLGQNAFDDDLDQYSGYDQEASTANATAAALDYTAKNASSYFPGITQEGLPFVQSTHPEGSVTYLFLPPCNPKMTLEELQDHIDNYCGSRNPLKAAPEMLKAAIYPGWNNASTPALKGQPWAAYYVHGSRSYTDTAGGTESRMRGCVSSLTFNLPSFAPFAPDIKTILNPLNVAINHAIKKVENDPARYGVKSAEEAKKADLVKVLYPILFLAVPVLKVENGIVNSQPFFLMLKVPVANEGTPNVARQLLNAVVKKPEKYQLGNPGKMAGMTVTKTVPATNKRTGTTYDVDVFAGLADTGIAEDETQVKRKMVAAIKMLPPIQTLLDYGSEGSDYLFTALNGFKGLLGNNVLGYKINKLTNEYTAHLGPKDVLLSQGFTVKEPFPNGFGATGILTDQSGGYTPDEDWVDKVVSHLPAGNTVYSADYVRGNMDLIEIKAALVKALHNNVDLPGDLDVDPRLIDFATEYGDGLSYEEVLALLESDGL